MNIYVAILDDGINDFMNINFINKKNIKRNYSELTHGSKVVATIKKYYCNNNIRFYSFDIFNSNNSAMAIIKALVYCLFHDVDMIVMSFTLSSCKHYFNIISFLLFLLHRKRVILVAAAGKKDGANDNFPASNKYVIGVGNEDNKLYSKFIQIRENIKPEFVKTGDEYHLFSGTSKANAIVAAKIINRCNFKDINEAIASINKENRRKRNLKGNMHYYNAVYMNCLKILKWSNDEVLFENGYSLLEIENIILKLLDAYNITERCLDMNFNNIRSIHEISKFIGNCLYEKM